MFGVLIWKLISLVRKIFRYVKKDKEDQEKVETGIMFYFLLM